MLMLMLMLLEMPVPIRKPKVYMLMLMPKFIVYGACAPKASSNTRIDSQK